MYVTAFPLRSSSLLLRSASTATAIGSAHALKDPSTTMDFLKDLNIDKVRNLAEDA
jgi:hypothetical protein